MNDEALHPVDKFDTAIEWVLVLLLAFMPLAFGAVQAWSELVVIAGAAALSLLLCLKLIVRRDARFVWTWAYIPIVLFLLLAVIQLIPLPSSVVSLISPNTVETKAELLADLPDADELLASTTLSFYPLATKHDLRIILAIAAVFVVVVNIYRSPQQIRRLLTAIVIIGGGIAILTLLHKLTGAEKIYWFVESQSKPSGPFVNYNNYSQFANLSIGAALGLLLLNIHERFSPGHKSEGLTQTNQKSIHPVNPVDPVKILGFRVSPAALLAGVFILGATAILLSSSRGGAISLLAATIFTAVVLSFKRRFKGRGWIMAPLAIGAFASILYLGFDVVYERLATLQDFEGQYKIRHQIVEGIGIASTKFPLLGAGLGTHEVFFPMFSQEMTSTSLAVHAENEYAQAIEEMGLLGLTLVALFAIFVSFQFARCARHGTDPIHLVAFVLSFGLVAVMVHSLSDFGQHLPANACLTATFCAILITLSPPSVPSSLRRSVASSLRRFVALPVIAAISIWSLLTATASTSAESHWSRTLQLERFLGAQNWQGTNEEFAELISRAAAASEAEPGNVHYRHWLNVYRWRSISRVRDEETGELVITPLQEDFTRRIIEELNGARRICPTFGPSHATIGQLQLFVLHDPAGAGHIRRAYSLLPNDPGVSFSAGMLDAYEDRIDESVEKLRHALALNAGLFAQIADLYILDIGRPDVAVELAADDIGRLSHVARILDKSPNHGDLAAGPRARVVDLLKTRADDPDAPAGLLAQVASIHFADGNYEAAIDLYSRALGRDYGQVGWRLAYAKTLAAHGQDEQAIHEARLCLRIRPQFAAARKLIEELSVKVGEEGVRY